MSINCSSSSSSSGQTTGKPRKKRESKTTKAKAAKGNIENGTISSDIAAVEAATQLLNSSGEFANGGTDEDVIDKLKHVAVVSKFLETNRDQVENASSLMTYARERNSKVDNTYRDLMDALDTNNRDGALDYANTLYHYAKVEVDLIEENTSQFE